MLREVIEEGHAEGAPLAHYHLGVLLLSADPTQAAEHFRAATLSRHLPVIVDGALRYADVHRSLGDQRGTDAGVLRAAFSGLPDAPTLTR